MNHLEHGIGPAERLLKEVQLHGSRSRALERLMNGDQPWSQALREWRQDLITSLGGSKSFTPDAWEVLSVVTIDKVINDSIAAYLMTHPAVNRQKKKVFEIVMQRSKLEADYVSRLRTLRETIRTSSSEEDVEGVLRRLK